MKNQNLFSCYLRGAERRADAVAVHAGDRSYSYADLVTGSARYANALADLGARPGERVCAVIDKSPAGVLLYLACLRAGLVYQPLNPAFQDAEMDYFLADATPALTVCPPPREERMRAAAARHGGRTTTLDRHGGGDLAAAAAAASPEFATRRSNGSDTACLLYSSGTTGKPKGVPLSHDNLAVNVRTLVDLWGFTPADVLIHALPLFHIHGLFVALGCALTAGAALRFLEKFSADDVILLLSRSTVLMGVPTFYARLLQSPALTRKACAGMRLFISGSAPLRESVFVEFRERTGHDILERYGMSEAGMIASNPLTGRRRPGAVGMPLPGVRVKVADDDGAAAAAGAVGELLVKGDSVFAGYWNLEEATRQAFTADGWFRTGDLAQQDAAGCIRIAGRARELIISGGENVYPREVELCLESLDGVREAAVFGVDDADLGEKVVAALVADPGRRLDEGAIIAALRTRLAGFKTPRRLCFLEELPRNAMGKIQKSKLAQDWRRRSEAAAPPP